RFVLPHSPQDRPAWLIRLGLFLYDHLGGRKRLPPTRVLDLRSSTEGEALRDEFSKGFEYSDCWVDDARLVVLNAMDARERGATILPRTRFVGARREQGGWVVETRTQDNAAQFHRARILVNAAGPWVNQVLDQVIDADSNRQVRLVKGSHLVIPKFWQGQHAYLIQNQDRRVIFVNPYEGDFALIGTTDIPQQGAPDSAEVETGEVDYLLDTVNRYFNVSLQASDVIESFAGVRPLFDDKSDNPSAVTRDYVFDIDGDADTPPLVSVFGGKITTFRKLAEHALDKLDPWIPDKLPRWTRSAHLPGGDMEDADFDRFLAGLTSRYPQQSESLLRHYARLYGTRVHVLLNEKAAPADLGEAFAPDFHEVEARYLIEHEWATTAEDILQRRTKHGLHMNEQQKQRFSQWCQANGISASTEASLAVQ
ncbi:MAG: glycerol-3-phosphate dehydrogenase, partial [Gammaproteobacteria bacterium]|nr:glycerol-3-phosphate dehydrogenase [Gammaproteobacteria bacterium]